MDILREYWPFLVPLIIAELALMVTALIHVLRHPTYRFGTRALWIPIVVFIQIIGPVVYFILGRSEDA